MKIGFFSILTLIFITLKLTDNIDWSWWLVMLPFYGSLLVQLVFLVIYIVIEGSKPAKRRRHSR